MDNKNGRITVEGFMDSFQAGNLLSGCGNLALYCLSIIAGLLGMIGFGILFIGSLISDLWFGDGP